jgi:hypothetical protein
MKKFKIIIIIIILASLKSHAHRDVTVVKDYGNIQIIASSGFYYEELNKCLIAGRYINLLSKEVGFKDTITINFKHIYKKDNNPSITFKKYNNDKNFLVIYEKSNFNIKKILNLIEYLLTNKLVLKDLSESDIEEIESKAPSAIVKSILSRKIYRSSEITSLKLNNTISYFIQDCKYHIYHLANKKEEVLGVFDDVYQINSVSPTSSIIFDTKNSFVYLNFNNKKSAKKGKHLNEDNLYMPYVVNTLSKDIISITLSEYLGREVVVLYFVSKEKWIKI